MSKFSEVLTNIFGDTELASPSPDSSGDYYFITDRQADFNYWMGKIIDVFHSISTDPDEEFKIIYGGEVTDGGSGTVDIAECIGITVDSNGNRRLVYFPGLTGVSLPSGYDDERLVYVTLLYDFKLGSSTRDHRAGGLSYHYDAEDTYFGDSDGEEGGSSDDLFTDSDPTGTALIIGAFTMNGTTFTDFSKIYKSEELIIAQNVQVEWTSPVKLGSGFSIAGGNADTCALSDTDVAFIDPTIHELRTYRFDGSTWSLVGSGLNITGIGNVSLASLSSTDVAFIDDTLEELRTYRFNGSTWSLVGSGLSISGIGDPSLCALNSTDIAFIDPTLEELRTYRFNGSTWSLVGSGLSISGIGNCNITALNSTDVAFIDSTLDSLRLYRFNGSTWSLVGSGFSLIGIGYPALTAINGTDIAFVDTTIEYLRIYRFDFVSETWSPIGSYLDLNGIANPSLTAINGTDVVFFDGGLQELTTYRFGFSIMGRPYRPFEE